MTKNKNRKQDQQIPENNDFHKAHDLTESIPAGNLFPGEHEKTVHHKENGHAEITEVVNGIVYHAYTVQPHNSQTGNTLDQIQILISLFQSPRPLYPLYKNILYDEPVTLQLLPVRVILLIKHDFS